MDQLTKFAQSKSYGAPTFRAVKFRQPESALRQDIQDAFQFFTNQGCEGVLVTADPLFNDLSDTVIAAATAQQLPTIYQWRASLTMAGS